MVKAADLAGAAHLMLVDGISYLDPEPAVFEAMLEGWTKQQRARFLKWEGTIKPQLSLVRRFAEFSNQYPWQWQPAEFEAFIDHLRTKTPTFTVSSGRNYQNHLRLFCEYITDPRYDWMSVCQERFGQVPVQILHEWNTVTHVSEYEGDPSREAADLRRDPGPVRRRRRPGRGDPKARPQGRVDRDARLRPAVRPSAAPSSPSPRWTGSSTTSTTT
ncbi:hypothetical protein [Streptomyces sp. SP17KL33]|uniref:hypothetical protein n=1 Tax=Streptomyces sp. SP17KL33 TaxID=3002534 RepID=UPI002E75AFE7|nr:hypothetical protein [Streptomyces sp. SP17KL33]